MPGVTQTRPIISRRNGQPARPVNDRATHRNMQAIHEEILSNGPLTSGAKDELNQVLAQMKFRDGEALENTTALVTLYTQLLHLKSAYKTHPGNGTRSELSPRPIVPTGSETALSPGEYAAYLQSEIKRYELALVIFEPELEHLQVGVFPIANLPQGLVKYRIPDSSVRDREHSFRLSTSQKISAKAQAPSMIVTYEEGKEIDRRIDRKTVASKYVAGGINAVFEYEATIALEVLDEHNRREDVIAALVKLDEENKKAGLYDKTYATRVLDERNARKQVAIQEVLETREKPAVVQALPQTDKYVVPTASHGQREREVAKHSAELNKLPPRELDRLVQSKPSLDPMEAEAWIVNNGRPLTPTEIRQTLKKIEFDSGTLRDGDARLEELTALAHRVSALRERLIHHPKNPKHFNLSFALGTLPKFQDTPGGTLPQDFKRGLEIEEKAYQLTIDRYDQVLDSGEYVVRPLGAGETAAQTLDVGIYRNVKLDAGSLLDRDHMPPIEHWSYGIVGKENRRLTNDEKTALKLNTPVLVLPHWIHQTYSSHAFDGKDNFLRTKDNLRAAFAQHKTAVRHGLLSEKSPLRDKPGEVERALNKLEQELADIGAFNGPGQIPPYLYAPDYRPRAHGTKGEHYTPSNGAHGRNGSTPVLYEGEWPRDSVSPVPHGLPQNSSNNNQKESMGKPRSRR